MEQLNDSTEKDRNERLALGIRDNKDNITWYLDKIGAIMAAIRLIPNDAPGKPFLVNRLSEAAQSMAEDLEDVMGLSLERIAEDALKH